MTVRYWIGNAQFTAQIVTGTITAVATNATVSATINDKTLTYTCEAGDTAAVAAAGLVALCSDQDSPPEFQEIDWTSDGADVVATASTPGTPFAGMSGGLVFSASGGATIVQTTTQANSSPSDVANSKNWATAAGVTGLPQSGDSLMLQASAVPLLWNLDYFSGTSFTAITRWGDFAGQIGLPPENVNGYREFRPQYFQCGPRSGGSSSAGPGTAIALLLGMGNGSGPALEAWDVGTQQATITVMSGQAIRFLGTNALNTGTIQNATVTVANLGGEVSSFTSLEIDGGANVTLGGGVSFSGDLSVSNGQLTLYVATATLLASNNSTVIVRSQDTTHPSVTAEGGTTITWLGNSNITTLTLRSGATLDKSQSILPMTITNSTVDGGSNSQVLDPFSTITWTNATTVNGQVTTGPFTFLGPRTVKIT